MRSELLSKSTHSQVSPKTSPCRIPVNSVTRNTVSWGWPFTAVRKALMASSSKGFNSLRSDRGSVQASDGLKRKYPMATACWSALCSTPWVMMTVFAARPFSVILL